MVGRTDTKSTPLSINTRGNVRIEGDGGTANGLWVTGGASVDALYVQGDAFFSGAVDCGNKGKLAARFGLLMLDQNHLIYNTQLKEKVIDFAMLVLKAQR